MLFSLRKNGPTSIFKEVRACKERQKKFMQLNELLVPPGTKPIHKQFAWNFFLHSHGCEYRRGMYSHRNAFLKNLATYSENNSPNRFSYNSPNGFSCIRASANTGPACILAETNSPRLCSCMHWFCAGGYGHNMYLTTLEFGKRGVYKGRLSEETMIIQVWRAVLQFQLGKVRFAAKVARRKGDSLISHHSSNMTYVQHVTNKTRRLARYRHINYVQSVVLNRSQVIHFTSLWTADKWQRPYLPNL